MDIEVATKIIHLDVKTLGDPIDGFLNTLFTSFFSTYNKPYSKFIEEYHQELVLNINSYLDGKIGDPPGHDSLFNNLTIIWNTYQLNGRVSEAQQFWHDILDIILKWELSRNKRIHKGSIFYFWSQTAILQGQLDKGFFLIHSAYEEDVLTHNAGQPDSPSYKTVSLNFDDKNNLLYSLVSAWAQYLERFLDIYRRISGSKITLKDFQNKFLNSPPSKDTLFSFTYSLARFYDFDLIPPTAIQGNFASLFELKALFDLVLVIDSKIYSSISHPGKEDWKFFNLATLLLAKSGISNNPNNNSIHLGNINSANKADFEKTLKELLDQRYIFVDGVLPSRLECDIAISYCLRNYSAHNIISVPVIRDRYSEIRQSIFNVLFLAVEYL